MDSESADSMQLSLADRIGDGSFETFSRRLQVIARTKCSAALPIPSSRTYVFDAETAAYRIAVEHPKLRSYVPEYFGPIAVAQVLDVDGTDVSDGYWLHLAYAMRRLTPDPEERKFGSFYNCSEWHLMPPLEEAFESAGIRHLGDASVFYWTTASPVLIDFAVSEAAGDHARIMPQH